GNGVTRTARVSGVGVSGGGAPTGTVTFLDGTTVLSSSPLAATTTYVYIYVNGYYQYVPVSTYSAQLSTTALASGSHNLTASYGGDTNYTASVSSIRTQIITPARSVSLTSSLTSLVYGQPVTFTSTVQPTSTSVGALTGSVTFYSGTTNLGTVSLSGAGQAILTTSLLSVGTDTVTAVYNG